VSRRTQRIRAEGRDEVCKDLRGVVERDGSEHGQRAFGHVDGGLRGQSVTELGVFRLRQLVARGRGREESAEAGLWSGRGHAAALT
jgi:hypothetical protein